MSLGITSGLEGTTGGSPPGACLLFTAYTKNNRQQVVKIKMIFLIIEYLLKI